jgi:hypothetical protein
MKKKAAELTLHPFERSDLRRIISWVPTREAHGKWCGSFFAYPLETSSSALSTVHATRTHESHLRRAVALGRAGRSCRARPRSPVPFEMAAEIERGLISQRAKEALRFKKAHGMKPGRPTGPGKSKLDSYRPEIESLLANGSTQKFFACPYHTTEASLHNWLKKHGLKLSKGLVPVLTSPKGIHEDVQT